MILVKYAVKLAVPNPALETYERFLFVGPHPDDIEIGAGASIAKLAAMGKEICFLICTDGRFGDQFSEGVKGDDLAVRRRKECMTSAETLGVFDVRFLELCDGAAYSRKALLKGIASVICDFKPDVIFGPDPNSRSESHPDHLNVGTAVRTLSCFAPYEGIMQKHFGLASAPVKAAAYYMTARPNRFVKTDALHRAKQLKSIFGCHVSQYPKDSPEGDALKLYLRLRSAEYGLKHFCSGAEGFRVLTAVTMHCIPEAGE